MDVRQLEILRELGELGSVRAVAEALRITPSAVSQQLKLLQRSTPVPLTRRQGRHLVLTDAGVQLAAAAAEVATSLARARDVVDRLSRAPQGVVAVSAFSSAAMGFFPALVRTFPADDPIRVTVADEDVAQTEFPPLTSAYDVVLAHRFEHTPAWPASVHAVPLLREPLDVALPEAHPLTARSEIPAEAAAAEPWISTHAGFPVGAIIDALATVSGRPVDVVHHVNEFTIAGELVRAGAGLALVPRWTTPRPPGVVLRPLTGVRSVRLVDALMRPESALRPAVQAVVAALRGRAAELAA